MHKPLKDRNVHLLHNAGVLLGLLINQSLFAVHVPAEDHPDQSAGDAEVERDVRVAALMCQPRRTR